MKILSFHNSLEASAAIYIDGKIKAAVSEERFNRVKNFHGFPDRSIDYLFKKFKLSFKKVDYVIYGIIGFNSSGKVCVYQNRGEIKKIPINYQKKFEERIKSEIKWNKKHLKELFTYAKKKQLY